MPSGIYEYIFDSGENYVGQAIDIKKRWSQHVSKMESGQHTKSIQQQYNQYGLPSFRVLLECHPHYLDPIEALLISSLQPTLNVTIPATYDDMDVTLDNMLLNRSLYKNLEELQRLRVTMPFKDEEINALRTRIISIAKENMPDELKNEFYDIQVLKDYYQTRSEVLESRINNYNQKSWFHRLFHTV